MKLACGSEGDRRREGGKGAVARHSSGNATQAPVDGGAGGAERAGRSLRLQPLHARCQATHKLVEGSRVVVGLEGGHLSDGHDDVQALRHLRRGGDRGSGGSGSWCGHEAARRAPQSGGRALADVRPAASSRLRDVPSTSHLPHHDVLAVQGGHGRGPRGDEETQVAVSLGQPKIIVVLVLCISNSENASVTARTVRIG